MAANINDLITQATDGTRAEPTTLTSSRNIGDGSISVNALTGWPTGSAVHFSIYEVDISGKKVAGSQTDWKGIASGTTISGLELMAGTDNGDPIGAIVVAGPTAMWANDLFEALTEEHSQVTGKHTDVTATSVTTPAVSVDTISEKTTNHGVTIDGLNIKDGAVAPGSIVKASLEKPHYNALFFSTDSGTVFSNAEVTVPFDASDTTNGYGITATTGASAKLTITRDGLYDIQFRFTCIDVNATDFIAWIWISPDGGVSTFNGFRRQDQSIGVGQGETFSINGIFLASGTIVYAEHYNGTGSTRFGTSNSGTSSSQLNRILHESLTVKEVR